MSPLALSLRFLQTQPDSRLVELARQGHEVAFEVVVRRYRAELLRYCRRLMPEVASAEDTLQQALLQAWRALKTGAEIRDIRAWLYRIAHNVAMSHLRAAGAEAQEIGDAPGSLDVDDVVQQRLRARAALAGIASLPRLQRQVLVSTTLDGASHEEVATALGLSNGSVRGLIYRARAAVRAAAAAVIPSPALSWAIRHAESSGGRTSAFAEAALGGGGAGLAGLIAKGGTVIAVAGAVVAGGVIVPRVATHYDGGNRHADVNRARGSSTATEPFAADRAHGLAIGNGLSGALTSASVAGEEAGVGPRRDHNGGSRGGSGDRDRRGRDGGSPDGSTGDSSGGPTGTAGDSSDGGSSLAAVAASSGGTLSGGGSSSMGGGSSGTSSSDGGIGGTSGGQTTTTPGGGSGSDGGSSGVSGSGDSTTTSGTH
jgi:RNA polymerase sigma factor (sigma-70 family)